MRLSARSWKFHKPCNLIVHGTGNYIPAVQNHTLSFPIIYLYILIVLTTNIRKSSKKKKPITNELLPKLLFEFIFLQTNEQNIYNRQANLAGKHYLRFFFLNIPQDYNTTVGDISWICFCKVEEKKITYLLGKA